MAVNSNSKIRQIVENHINIGRASYNYNIKNEIFYRLCHKEYQRRVIYVIMLTLCIYTKNHLPFMLLSGNSTYFKTSMRLVVEFLLF